MTAGDLSAAAVTASDLAGRQALLQDASRRAEAYLAGLAGRAVAPPPAAVGALDALDFPLPASGRPAPEVLALLDDVGSPGTVASAACRRASRSAPASWKPSAPPRASRSSPGTWS